MSGNGEPFDIMTARKPPDTLPLPSAAAIPGLVCTVEDDDASRDARSEDWPLADARIEAFILPGSNRSFPAATPASGAP